MAKETRMHMLMVDYDEEQKDVLLTFGTTRKELTNLLNLFIDSANNGEDETYTSKIMSLIKSGDISGGMILALATQSIISTLENNRFQTLLDKLIEEFRPETGEDTEE